MTTSEEQEDLLRRAAELFDAIVDGADRRFWALDDPELKLRMWLEAYRRSAAPSPPPPQFPTDVQYWTCRCLAMDKNLNHPRVLGCGTCGMTRPDPVSESETT